MVLCVVAPRWCDEAASMGRIGKRLLLKRLRGHPVGIFIVVNIFHTAAVFLFAVLYGNPSCGAPLLNQRMLMVIILVAVN